MQKLCRIMMATLCMCSVFPVLADGYKGKISGLGVDSCATYVLALNEDRPTSAIEISGKTYFTQANAYTQWVVGFVNAVDWVSATSDSYKNGKRINIRLSTVDVNAVALSVKKICEDAPDMVLAVAVMNYVNKNSR